MLKEEGAVVEKFVDPFAEEDFTNAAMDIDDYSQNYIVDGAKLTFFTSDEHHARLLASPLQTEGPTIPSLEELRGLKVIVCSFRSKSRDWLDIYTLATEHGYSPRQWKADFLKAGLSKTHFNTALKRIASAKTDLDDPGFHTLLPNPPGIDLITSTLTFLAQQAFSNDNQTT